MVNLLVVTSIVNSTYCCRFRVRDLPVDRNDMHAISKNIYPQYFPTVMPFVRQLRDWIYQARIRRALKAVPRDVETVATGDKKPVGRYKLLLHYRTYIFALQTEGTP